MKKGSEIKKSYVGIDVSKLTIDVCVLFAAGVHEHRQFENKLSGFNEMSAWLESQKNFNNEASLYCMEHTGLYTRELVKFLIGKGSKVWMESALHMKRSMGMTRGKNDKVDAYRIARYAMTNEDKARPVQENSRSLQQIRDLLSNRSRINKAYHALKISVKEMLRIDKQTGKELQKLNAGVLKEMEKAKRGIEKRIVELINEDPGLKELYALITSVKGVGKILATQLIVYTHGFTRLTNAKQLACYCGVVPFNHTSGSSVRGRAGTSNFANMEIKATLHLVAMSSARYVSDLKIYYVRKVGEGKSKMSVINAIRNKILQRILAVIKRGTPYQENFNEKSLENS